MQKGFFSVEVCVDIITKNKNAKFCGVTTLLKFIVAAALTLESIHFLVSKQAGNAVHWINKIFKSLEREPLKSVPPRPVRYGHASLRNNVESLLGVR